MEQVNVRIGPVSFDRADYDENDVPICMSASPRRPRARRPLRVTSSATHRGPSTSLASLCLAPCEFSTAMASCWSRFPSRSKQALTISRRRSRLPSRRS